VNLKHDEIILEALRDYRKWYEEEVAEDFSIVKEIDEAIEEVKKIQANDYTLDELVAKHRNLITGNVIERMEGDEEFDRDFYSEDSLNDPIDYIEMEAEKEYCDNPANVFDAGYYEGFVEAIKQVKELKGGE
jgi:uncharacterized protein YacL (UPF0231 family)